MTTTDGRSRRWDDHRAARREDLVRAAATAIETHGPDAHVEAIAAQAGVSKPVLYRYFSDKDELLAATAQWAAAEIVEAMTQALRADLGPHGNIAAAVDAFLTQVEVHRNLFVLVTRHQGPAVDGSLAREKSAAAAVLARALRDALTAAGADPRGSDAYAHAIVGSAVAAAEWWLAQTEVPRAEVAGHLTEFVWHAVEGLLSGSSA